MSYLRQIVIDNKDPTVKYDGDWFLDPTVKESYGNLGAPLFNSQQGTTSKSAALSFPFDGTSIVVYGSIWALNQNNKTSPSWECFVDGSSIGFEKPPPTSQNNWPLCKKDGLSSQPHNLSLSVTTDVRTFWFDYATYIPTSNSSSNPAILKYPSSDAIFQYDRTWAKVDPESMFTNATEGQVSISFIGREFWWHAPLLDGFPHASSLATYTLDDSQPVSFRLKGLNTSLSLFNTVYFSIVDLKPGPHKLTVRYKGVSTQSPLILSHAYIVNATNVAYETNPSQKVSKVLIGGVVGTVVAAIFIVVATIFYFRKRREEDMLRAREFKRDLFSIPKHERQNLTSPPVTPFLAESGSATANTFPTGKTDKRLAEYSPQPFDLPASWPGADSSSGLASASTSDHYQRLPTEESDADLSMSKNPDRISSSSHNTTRRSLLPGETQTRPLSVQQSRSHLVIHIDSGVRLSIAEGEEEEVEELPPMYTHE